MSKTGVCLAALLGLVASLAMAGIGDSPGGPGGNDPLGLAGTWVEDWPGVRDHDVFVVGFQNGQYSVQAASPNGNPYRIENVRVEGNVLRFVQRAGPNAIQYEVRAQDAATCSARATGGPPRGGDQIVWRRQGAPPVVTPPFNPPLDPPIQPGGADPLGLAGSWLEYWPGVGDHDTFTVGAQNGQYSVQAAHPTGRAYRIENVRVEGNVLRFVQQAGTNLIQYEVRLQDANTCSARATGGPPRGADQIVWRRQGGPPVGPGGGQPTGPPRVIPFARPGDRPGNAPRPRDDEPPPPPPENVQPGKPPGYGQGAGR